jgi:hypothetical protein
LTPRAAALAISLVALFAGSAAEAQNVRFIRTNGNDANPCTLAQPCRTLARGVQAAPVRGEVRLLDSGAFGDGVGIAKSLTISGNGNTLILDGPISVGAGLARVAFRDLLLNGLGTVPNGIAVSAAATVHVVRCELERFEENGLLVDAGETEIFVVDSILRNNGQHGMELNGSGAARLTVDNSRFENNGVNGAELNSAQSSVTRSTFSGNAEDGLFAFGGAISIARSVAAGNGRAGFAAGNGSEMQLESSVSRGNSGSDSFIDSGLFVGSNASASISATTLTDNPAGILNFGDVRTRGNNRVFGNGIDYDDFDGSGTLSALGGT